VSEAWVINASPVILLAKAGLIECVPSLVETFVIPEPVVAEVVSIGRDDAASLWLSQGGKQYVRPAVAELPTVSEAAIGAGERSVISWAVANSGYVAVLDDREARAVARRLNVRVIGTVGVVLRLKTAGQISVVKTHLLKIKQVGGFVSDELFCEALRLAGEKP
jgi:predicted nucleic acid-binding protein